ncbi:MAG: hypothetical protein R3Y57_01020 [Erysipelotrichaceae bacterium]
MDIISILGLAIVAYLLYLIINLKKRNKKNKKYIDCIESLDEEELFLKKMEAYYENLKDEEFITKGKIIELYGAILHKQKQKYDRLLEEINISSLIYNGKGEYDQKKITLNEDSYYYLYFLITLTLYSQQDSETLKKVDEKIMETREVLEDHMFFELYEGYRPVYFNEETQGEAFKNLLEGNYDSIYAKQMIGLYKKTGACLYASILIRREEEDFSLVMEEIEVFKTSNLGKKVINLVNISSLIKEEENEENISE